jgi:hypothetical protein
MAYLQRDCLVHSEEVLAALGRDALAAGAPTPAEVVA